MLVLGVGNPMKGDDGVGPYVASLLSAEPDGSLTCDAACHVRAIDCGTVPENYTSMVRRMHPDILVIVDAAEMGLPAGACRVIPLERAGALGLSTHSMPLSLFASYVCEMAASTILVGVQPRSMNFGTELSEEVRKAGQVLASMLAQGTLSTLQALD